MIQIANANIVRAIRGLATRSPGYRWTKLFSLRSVEPADYMRVIADELNVPKVYFPNEPGSSVPKASPMRRIFSGKASRSTKGYPITPPGAMKFNAAGRRH